MSQRLISGALRKVAWIGAVGGRVLRRRRPVLSRAERACRPEAAAAGTCLQRHPLLPDDRWSGVLPIRLEVVPGRYQRDVLASESLTNGTCPPQAEEPRASL